jgi:hypothetical protein
LSNFCGIVFGLLCECEIFSVGTANVVSMSLVETKINEGRHKTAAEHNSIRSADQSQRPQNNRSDHERQRDVSTTKLNFSCRRGSAATSTNLFVKLPNGVRAIRRLGMMAMIATHNPARNPIKP